MGREVGRKFKTDMHIYVYLWLIHVDIWQKPSHYYNYPPIKNKIKFLKSRTLLYRITKSGHQESDLRVIGN